MIGLEASGEFASTRDMLRLFPTCLLLGSLLCSSFTNRIEPFRTPFLLSSLLFPSFRIAVTNKCGEGVWEGKRVQTKRGMFSPLLSPDFPLPSSPLFCAGKVDRFEKAVREQGKKEGREGKEEPRRERQTARAGQLEGSGRGQHRIGDKRWTWH